MNKGWLLKSFDFKYENLGQEIVNTMFLYSGSQHYKEKYKEQRTQDIEAKEQEGIRFRYATNVPDWAVTDMYFEQPGFEGWAMGGLWDINRS